MRYLQFLVIMVMFATAFGQDTPQPILDDLNLLVGKQVVVGRMPLCTPKTFTANLNYSGKTATVVSVKPNTMRKLPSNMLNRMTPDMRAMMEDAQNGATLLLQFEDGTTLDTCAAIGPKKLAENLELAPGQTITPVATAQPVTASAAGFPPAASNPVASAPQTAATSAPQECPVIVTKVTSGDGGFGHAMADGLTTSEFQRQLDQTTHGGHSKHYLDMRMRNNSQKPVAAIESVVVYANKMGDETLRDTLISQNTKPIKPGEEHKSYSMDRAERTQNGAGLVTLYISCVRFEDNTFWQDNGSRSCSLTNQAK